MIGVVSVLLDINILIGGMGTTRNQKLYIAFISSMTTIRMA